MHQISLLGDPVPRHGGASHVMRPDRVYKTSVLSPMVGYDPGTDVQYVANEFTTGPQSGMTLSGPAYRPVIGMRPPGMHGLAHYRHGQMHGLGYTWPTTGWLSKVHTWWQTHFPSAAQRAANAANAAIATQAMMPAAPATASTPMSGLRGLRDASVPDGSSPVAVTMSPYGPAAQMAPWLGPQAAGLPQSMVAAAYGQSSAFPQNMQTGIDKTTMMFWRGLRWPWHS